MKYWIALSLLTAPLLHSHCQMPCGIYHDDMVYDQIDQYVETMVKGVTVLSENQYQTAQDKNTFTRWVVQKENMSNETAQLLTSYFLQQKIKPDEDDTVKRVVAVHKLLCYIVTIKQTCDMKYVQAFSDEWDKFKLMFHIEGYECKMEKIKLTQWGEKTKANEAKANQATPQLSDTNHDEMHQHGVPHQH